MKTVFDLTQAEIDDIRSTQVQRERLLAYIRENLSEVAVAQKFGVSRNTVQNLVNPQRKARNRAKNFQSKTPQIKCGASNHDN